MKLYIFTFLTGVIAIAFLYAGIRYHWAFLFFFTSTFFLFVLLVRASIQSFNKAATYYEIKELTKKKYRYNLKKRYQDECR